MGDKPAFYITTAISYPNGPPHIGHAYEAIATDALARFKRLDGYDVFFLTGTDEHGLKMVKTARDEGISTAELADRNTPLFQEMCAQLNCSNDDFIRTREERHIKASQAIWQRMAENGDIYLDKYSGWYSVRDEAYYDDSELTENGAGEKLSPQGTPVEWVEEETYFFKLSAYQDRLLKHYQDNPDFIGPDVRRNEVVSFVQGGLRDLSVSRTNFDWGVPVPGDESHVMYVWVDALTNYITGVGYPDETSSEFRKFWPADVHVIGKDIIRFHSVYWPAFLMSAGIEPPKRVFAHGFLFNRGEKMSKSVGNVVDPASLIEHFGVDQLRYFFLREVPFGRDGNYTHEAIVNRINADLANDLGNLAQRSLSMIAKNCGSVLPDPWPYLDGLSEGERAIRAGQFWDVIDLKLAREKFDQQDIYTALDDIWKSVADANRWFANEEPWALKKTNPAQMDYVLYATAEKIRQIAIVLQPVMPSSMKKILDLLAVPMSVRTFEFLSGCENNMKPGTLLPKPEAVFPRYVEAEESKA